MMRELPRNEQELSTHQIGNVAITLPCFTLLSAFIWGCCTIGKIQPNFELSVLGGRYPHHGCRVDQGIA